MLRSTRRKFAFYFGLGLFSLSERLQANVLDDLAAASMPASQTSKPIANGIERPEHWTASENSDWSWFERENFFDGRWSVTGITTPINRLTGERYAGATGYLSDDLVPEELRAGGTMESATEALFAVDGDEDGQPSAERRSRHGRPPSKWLRKLNATELRIWLKRIKVPEAGVNGMTYWTHLTRDHSFDEVLIDGLTEDEQAKLHAAAHFGY